MSTTICPVEKTIFTSTPVIGAGFSGILCSDFYEVDDWGNLRRMGDWDESFAIRVMSQNGTVPSVRHLEILEKIQSIFIKLAKERKGRFCYFDVYQELGEKAIKEIEHIFSGGMNEACQAAGATTLKPKKVRLSE